MKIHKRIARKDYPDNLIGGTILKGKEYYSWTPYRGPKQRSLVKPLPYEMSSSPGLSAVGALQRRLMSVSDFGDYDRPDLDTLADLVNEIETALDTLEESISNLEEHGLSNEDLNEARDLVTDWLFTVQALLDYGDEDHDEEVWASLTEDELGARP